MSPNRRSPAGSTGHLIWIVVAVVLVLLIGLSFVMSSRARQDAETEAEERAERYAVSGLPSQVTPEAVEGDILGTAYRELLADMQSGIMSDTRVLRIRIWRPDGDLIFSTEARDEVESFVAVDDAQIQLAADGQTTSVISEADPAPPAGLEGSDVDLFVTYVPLRFANETEPSAVVEITQAYAVVQDETNRIWRPVQIGLFVALGGLAVLFGISQRRGRSSTARWGDKPARVTRDERKLRDAEDRALAAERAARVAEGRLTDAERRVEELTKADAPPEVRARLDELELKLRSEQAEREQFAGEAKRLRSALSEREAELALVRDKTISTEAERARSIDAVQRAEQQTAEAERRAAAAGTLAGEAEGRAAKAEARVVELETALRDADRRLTGAVAEAHRVAEEARRDEESRAITDLRATQLEATDLKLKLGEVEAALKDSEARRAEGEGASAELARVRGDADAARTELEETRLDLQRTKLDLEASRDEADGARIELQASRAELEAARTELEVSRGDRDRETADRERVHGELEQVRSELDRLTAEREQTGADVPRLAAEREHWEAEAQRLTAERGEMEAQIQHLGAERDEMSAEIRRLTGELEAARTPAADEQASPAAAAEDEAPAAVAVLEARIAEMESQRRTELAELQRSQASLANTQLELVDATRRLKAQEERLIELETAAAGIGRAPEPASEPTYSETFPEPERPSRPAPPAADELVPEDDQAPATDELPDEALSLRERLARAAAARHRTVQPPD